jgi:hypothetical protein
MHTVIAVTQLTMLSEKQLLMLGKQSGLAEEAMGLSSCGPTTVNRLEIRRWFHRKNTMHCTMTITTGRTVKLVAL